jgi:hypothetical protein
MDYEIAGHGNSRGRSLRDPGVRPEVKKLIPGI